MPKQMMEISTAKSVDNALGDYISRTRDGQAWTKDDYDWQNNKGEQGRQYGVRDWSRSSLNFEIVGLHGKPVIQPIDHAKPSLQERWQRRIDEGYKAVVHTKKGDVKKPIKKSEVKIVKMELGGNRDRMHELAFDRKVNLGKRGIGTNGSVQRRQDIEDWAKDCYNHLAKKYGAANIIDFVVHLDETNPHVHVTIVPLTQDGKLSYTELFGGSHAQAVKAAQEQGTKPNFQRLMSNYVKQLHTDFAQEVGKRWGLERGDDIKITGNVHKSTAESLRKHNHLEEEISQLEDTRTRTESSVLSLTSRHDQLKGEVEELENAWHKADEKSQILDQRLQEKTKEVENLEGKQATLDNAIEKKKPILAEQRTAIDQNNAIIREQKATIRNQQTTIEEDSTTIKAMKSDLSALSDEWQRVSSDIVEVKQSQKWKARYEKTWKGVVAAIKAITDRILNRNARCFTSEQVNAIDRALSKNMDIRLERADQLKAMAREDLPEHTNEAWILSAEKDIDIIAQRDWKNLVYTKGQGIGR